ncbi:SGNH/GDSL hydrolase family protein [Streptomyces sp. NPDC051219]|uniref:SGNH/GDSL hydrolase family protein n=1 Tax=Streptomyces sp. NPDC051219 TaxID=3155283 RepID=UPI00343A3C7A
MSSTSDVTAEQNDPYCMAPAAATDLLSAAPWQRFVVMGDSVAEGLGDTCEGYGSSPWADRVATALRTVNPGLAYLNLGERDLIASEIRSQQLDKALSFKGDLVAVIAGGNDMLRKSFDVDATEAELARIIAPLRASGADVITMGLFDISQSDYIPEQYKEGLRARLRLLSDRTHSLSLSHGAVFVDLTSHPAGADTGIYSKDGRHVNSRGHAVAAAAVIRRLGLHLGVNGLDEAEESAIR